MVDQKALTPSFWMSIGPASKQPTNNENDSKCVAPSSSPSSAPNPSRKNKKSKRVVDPSPQPRPSCHVSRVVDNNITVDNGVRKDIANISTLVPEKSLAKVPSKGKKKKKKSVPQKGDPDYLSPTQLRNRRKRRGEKRKKQLRQQKLELQKGEAHHQSHEQLDVAGNVIKNKGDAINHQDPSLQYISNPKKAPVVQNAIRYFRSLGLAFHVHLGPRHGWRTVSKLAVRPAVATTTSSDTSARLPNQGQLSPPLSPKVAIGLFLPQSHTLLPIPHCRAHHPSINNAVKCLTRACHDVGIAPYHEAADTNNKLNQHGTDGQKHFQEGQLRYVGINVERKSGKVQITLVWNGPPLASNGNGGKHKNLGNRPKQTQVDKITDPSLKKLVKRLISMSESNEESIKSETPTIFPNEADIKNATSDKAVKNEGTESNTAETIQDPPTKKRRRRGRRDTKSSLEGKVNQLSSINITTNANNNTVSNDIVNKGNNENNKSSGLKLNLHSLWINYNMSWKHSNAIFAFDSPSNNDNHNCDEYDQEKEASNWMHLYGPTAITEYLTFAKASSQKQHQLATPPPLKYPVPLHFPPNVFRQANLDAFTHIVARIREKILQLQPQMAQYQNGEEKHDDKLDTTNLDSKQSNSELSKSNSNKQRDESSQALPTCIELYGGVGTISLHLSDIVSHLISSDENPNNAKCFYDTVRSFPPTTSSSSSAFVRSKNITYKQKNAADMIITERDLMQKCNVLIVDPPRKGLDSEVLNYLSSQQKENTFRSESDTSAVSENISAVSNLRLVIYVSCGFQAFQRDCNALLQSGCWKLEFVEGYLLFPGSDAIETLAFFVPIC